MNGSPLEDRMGRKGMALETVGYLILAVIGLIMIWIFFMAIAPSISTIVLRLANDMKCAICNMMGAFKHMMGSCGNC